MADISISGLTTKPQADASDLVEVAAVDALSQTGYTSAKESLAAIGDLIANEMQFASDLQTTAKTLTGAINEAAQSGGGGGSEVVPNPQGVPTDTLDALEVDGDIYEIEKPESLYETQEATGDVAEISVADGGTVFENIIVNIEAVQEGTGDPSPSNVRPLTGYERTCVIRAGGKNVVGKLEVGTFSESSSARTTYANMKIDYATRGRTVDIIPVKPNMTISCAEGYLFAFAQFDRNGLYLGSTSFVSWSSTPYNSGWAAGVRFIALIFKRSDEGAITDSDFENVHLQVEVGLTATAYEPSVTDVQSWVIRNGSLNYGTYGGTVNLRTRELTITKQYIYLEGDDAESWGYYNGVFQLTLPNTSDYQYRKSNQSTGGLLCNQFKPIRMQTNTTNMSQQDNLTTALYSGTTSAYRIMFNHNTITTLDDWYEFLGSNPVELIYDLATPITVQKTWDIVTFPDILLQTLTGKNMVYATSGGIEALRWHDAARFNEDIKPYVDKALGHQYLEHQVGTWDDGRPVYERTIPFGSGITMQSGVAVDLNTQLDNGDGTPISAWGVDEINHACVPLYLKKRSDARSLNATQFAGENFVMIKMTVRYIKDSDEVPVSRSLQAAPTLTKTPISLETGDIKKEVESIEGSDETDDLTDGEYVEI